MVRRNGAGHLTPGSPHAKERPLDLAATILLRQLATDAGFDLVDEELDGGWMRVRSSHARLVSWLRMNPGEGGIEAGLSRPDVAAALGGGTGIVPGTPAPGSPGAMRAVLRVPDRAGARHLLRRAFQLARALPSGLIAVAEDGTVMSSMRLSPAARAALGLAEPRQIVGLLPGHARFLAWHRLKLWQERGGA